MKNFIIDTQLFLWWLVNSEKLSSKARKLIQEEEASIFLSAASVWEISIKSSIGKLPQIENVCKIAEEEGFELLAIEALHAERTRSLSFHHKDPFDRLLVAQAQVLGVQLVTSDKALKDYGKSVLCV